MYTLYMICAIVGGGIMVIQFVMLLLGFDGDASDMDIDVSVGEEGGDGSFLGILSFRTVVAAAAFFGITGLAVDAAGVAPYPTFVLAVAAGVAAMFLVAWLMRSLHQLYSEGNVRIENAVGGTGVVYLSIPGNRSGKGKVTVSIQDRTLQYPAMTKGDPLATGTPVLVVDLIGTDTLDVTSAVKKEGD